MSKNIIIFILVAFCIFLSVLCFWQCGTKKQLETGISKLETTNTKLETTNRDLKGKLSEAETTISGINDIIAERQRIDREREIKDQEIRETIKGINYNYTTTGDIIERIERTIEKIEKLIDLLIDY